MAHNLTDAGEVLLSINRIDPGRGSEAGLCIVALAIVMDRITQGFAKRYEESIAWPAADVRYS